MEYPHQLELSPIVNGKRVAIVGHATSLIGHGYGAEIDAADIVVRFHTRPVATDLADSIGRRVDMWYCGKIEACPRHMEIVDCKIDGVPVCCKKPKLLHFIRGSWNPVRPWLHRDEPPPNTWSCTGVVAVIDCLLSGAAEVRVYGFDFFRSADIHTGETVKNRQHLRKPVIAQSLLNDCRRLRLLKENGCPVAYDRILEDIISQPEQEG